jgi:C4-dicarboxylate-specific signal transduction histidine kinase
MVIEDSVFATKHVQKMLADVKSPHFEAELYCVDRISAGLEYLADNEVDVILLDLTLPDSHGLDTLIKICAQVQEVPVVVLTGLGDEKLAKEAVQKGAQDYLVKGQIGGNLLRRSILYSIERKKVEIELKKHRDNLEELVKERTADLTTVNRQLKHEVAERTQTEKALEDSFNELKRVHLQLEQSQSQLIQIEKMSAVGTLAAGIAHELNNPLMAILNFSNYCLKHTDKEDKRYSFLQDIEHEAGRCIEIVSNLLTFSRSEQDGKEEYQSESLARIINRVVRIMSYRINKEKVSLSTHVVESTPLILVKVGSMQQVILNLLTNALDAVGESQKKEIYIEVYPDGDSVCLTVTNTGRGIASEIMSKIYDPFFTTKPVGEGTGLGLTISRNIIESHGGYITCENKPGMGTTFKITLPVEKKGRG